MTYNLKNCPLMAGIYKINFPNGKSYIGLIIVVEIILEILTKGKNIFIKI